MRPIHVHQRMDFVMLCMNQLVNLAAKTRYLSGGESSLPMVVRAIIGRSWGQGAQHSQAFHSFFMHVPGIKVVAPATPYDAKGCMISAIRDDNPVMFIEHRMLYGHRGAVPQEPYSVPFGKARVLTRGADVTLVAISHMVSWLAVPSVTTTVEPAATSPEVSASTARVSGTLPAEGAPAT